jgi:F-type H+-transporting ATPase subunit 8
MPQLIPFYFLNQLTFAFAILIILIFIFSKYILPSFTYLQVTRLYITKLNKKKIKNFTP